MRLTLRTLLAWLDDTLPPAEVRDIGKQVSDSPYARELIERIHRVTRQRRLSVPGKTGPEGTDPNLVAGYVDNDLEPEQVAEYEKKCLGSDVNLAEVASVHQILSLLGQKVLVPGEAKARMYQLVKGREATPPPQVDGARPTPPPVPVTRPIQPWVAPEPPRRHWLERFGPAAACVGLIALLSWSAYESLTPPATQPIVAATPPGNRPAPPAAEVPGPAPDPLELNRDLEADKARPATAPAKEGAEGNPAAAVADASARPKQASPPPREIPAGAVGVVEKADGVLLRYSPEKREWERIAEGASLGGADRLLCLAPFRARISLGKAPLTLVGETGLRLTGKSPGDDPAFELQKGRVVVDSSTPPGHIKVDFAGHTVDIDRPAQGPLGIERTGSWQYGQPATQPAALAIHSPGGDPTIAMDRAKETLHGPGTVVADPAGKLQVRPEKAVPAWVGETAPSPKDQELGERFLKLFSAGRPVLTDIVVATEDPSPVTKKLAIHAVKALGDLSLLTPILSRPGDPDARDSTADALRDYLAQGPQAERSALDQLKEEFGDDTGPAIEKLLIGYTPEEASRPETFRHLVDQLTPRNPSLPVRELALENLMTLTGRNDQGYDPEKPEEKTYNTWKGLLSSGELKPAVARRKAAR